MKNVLFRSSTMTEDSPKLNKDFMNEPSDMSEIRLGMKKYLNVRSPLKMEDIRKSSPSISINKYLDDTLISKSLQIKKLILPASERAFYSKENVKT